MKWISFAHAGRTRPGAWLDGDRVVDLSPVAPSMVEIIEAGPDAWKAAMALAGEAKSTLAAAEVALLAPIPRPRKNVFCVGRNYLEHVAEGARAMGVEQKLPEVPQFFTKAPTAVNAPGAAVRLDAGLTRLLDYEVELAVVIGKAGRDIPK